MSGSLFQDKKAYLLLIFSHVRFQGLPLMSQTFQRFSESFAQTSIPPDLFTCTTIPETSWAKQILLHSTKAYLASLKLINITSSNINDCEFTINLFNVYFSITIPL